MKVKPFIKYNLSVQSKEMICFYAIMVALVVVMTFLGLLSKEGAMIGGTSQIDVMAAIFIFIVGLCSLKNEFHFGIQNGISRRTQFISFFISLVPTCLVMAVLNMVYCSLVGMLNSALSIGDVYIINTSTFQMIYAGRDVFTGAVSGFLAEMVWQFSLLFAVGSAGYLLTNIFFAFGQLGKVIFSVAIAAAFFALTGVGVGVGGEPGPVGKVVSRLFMFAFTGNPFNFVLVAICLAVVCGVIAWLFMRRAKIKTT